MAVNVGQRNVLDTPANRQLEACDKAMALVLHTIKICKNKNIFKEEYQDALTNDMIAIEQKLQQIGFELNTKKTLITPLSDTFTFLGFDYRLTSTGKVIMTLNSANVKHERKKLRRLVALAKQGKIPKAKADECFTSWKANANKGNSYKLIQRMNRYYDKLWRDSV